MNISDKEVIIIISVLISIILIIITISFWDDISSFLSRRTGSNSSSSGLGQVIINTNNGLTTLSSKLDNVLSKIEKQNSQLADKETKIRERDAKIMLLEATKAANEAEIGKQKGEIESSINELRILKETQNNAIDSLKRDYEQLLIKAKEDHARNSQINLDIIDKNKEIHLPVFMKSFLQEDFEKLHNDVLLNHPEAISLWTSLGSFKSSYIHGASSEFTLQILKQLGLDVVRYYASSENSNPQITHQKLSQWADCLNTNSNNRFSLFVPALGAAINNALMQSASGSAYSVTEVLCWGIRNPNGIVYSTALFR
jgi:hypothetical protein